MNGEEGNGNEALRSSSRREPEKNKQIETQGLYREEGVSWKEVMRKQEKASQRLQKDYQQKLHLKKKREMHRTYVTMSSLA